MVEDDLTDDDFDALEKEMLEEKKAPRGKRVLVCPVCGSAEISYYQGLKTGSEIIQYAIYYNSHNCPESKHGSKAFNPVFHSRIDGTCKVTCPGFF